MRGAGVSDGLAQKERELALAIVVWLRPEIVSRCDEWPSPGLLYHCISALNTGCRVLKKAGVFTDEGHYLGYAQDGADLNALPDCFDRRALDMAIFAFVQVEALDGLVQDRDGGYKPKNALQDRVFRSMAECGYMKRGSDGAYDWTIAAGPWLVAAEEKSLYEYEMASDEEVRRALALIPERALEWFKSEDYAPSFARMFLRHWYANEWHTQHEREFPCDDSDLPLTVALYLHMH
jgi:hypothetical protein